MVKRMENNFKKRFNYKIIIIYSDKPPDALQSQKIYEAFKDILSSLLGREPAANELLGVEDVSKKLKK